MATAAAVAADAAAAAAAGECASDLTALTAARLRANTSKQMLREHLLRSQLTLPSCTKNIRHHNTSEAEYRLVI